jgi:ABC-type dipeptide/oligopeptide/nickel transport system ATPase component
MSLVGEEGSGKSMTAIQIAQQLDNEFTADRVIFDVQELLERLKDDAYERGQAFVLDEAGVSLGRRTWQDRAQVLANQALQLIRSHNLALIFTLPSLSELDSQAVSRLQAYLKLEEKKDGKYVEGPWYYIQTDRSDNDRGNYTPKPRVPENGTDARIDSLRFSPPSGDVVDDYLEKKRQHQKETYQEAVEALSDDDEQEQELTPKQVATDIMENDPSKYVGDNHGTPFIEKSLIGVDYELGRTKTKRVKKLLERKGVLDDV